MKELPKWHTPVGGRRGRPDVRRLVEFLAALGAALVVQFGALPRECREHAARALGQLVGLHW